MEQRISPIQPSASSLRAKRQDTALRAILWAAAIATTAVFLFIVGFIFFRGIVSDNTFDYPFLAKGASVMLDDGKASVTVVVNQGTRITDLTAENVRGLFSGDIASWGDLSGQDLVPQLFVPARTGLAPMSVKRALLGDSVDWSPTAIAVADDRAVLRAVAQTSGAVGWVSSLPASGLKGVKAVAVRALSVLANPSVLALQNTRRLVSLTEPQLAEVFAGRVQNWYQVGGPDLPVRYVSLGTESWVDRQFADLVFAADWTPPAGTIVVSTVEELKTAVARTPGAVGIVPWRDVAANPERILQVNRREVRRNLSLAFLYEEPRRAGKVGGISTIVLNTVLMILLTLLFTTPIGVAAAMYLTEYTRRGKLVSLMRFGTETLAGIPSIIFGLFGFIVFVSALHLGIGLLSGTLTITMMLLPTIVRTSEEAIKAVPVSLREGSLALGATKWQTTVRVVIPAAVPGILTGVILAVGRAVGETAALLFTMGTDYRLVAGLRSSARVLSVHLFYLLKEGISFDRAFATGAILVIVVLMVNFLTTRLIGRMNGLRTEGGNGKAR